VQHRVRGKVQQLAAIDERLQGYALGQDLRVHLLHFFVHRVERGLRIGALLQAQDA
jgi:hypothetical protein